MPIGKKLSDLLNESNENVNSISTKIGVSPQTLYSIIKRDNMKVDFDVLIKLSKALNVSVEYFYEPQDVRSDKVAPKKIDAVKERLLKNYASLNQEGRERLCNYSDDLVSSGRYTKNNKPDFCADA